MLNSDQSKDDEGRLQRIVQRLTRNQTDVRRLWGRMGQVPDSMGLSLSGQQSVSIPYTPAAAPTTTTAPTTSTTTTPAPVTIYLYPTWDRGGGAWQCSSGTERYALVDDRDSWPSHSDYIHLPENENSTLSFWLDPLMSPAHIQSVEIELYCKNEILTDLLTFTAQVFGDDEVTALTDAVPITGVTNSEGSYSLRSESFMPTVDAQTWWNWSRPLLQLNVETDNDAGSPDFYISAVRIKVTYTPEF